MSVLSVPRIFFKGFSEWNPNTTNNNDQWPTYDFVNADFNWAYLATQTPTITPENVQTYFPQWIITPQFYEPNPPQPEGGWWQPPSEWNFFGGSEFLLYTTTTNQQTYITGSQLDYGGPIVTNDPLVNAVVNFQGDTYPGASTPTAARLVDVNPDAFWATNFLLRSVQIGDASDPARYLSGDVQPGTQMSSRTINIQRDMNTDGALEIAGTAGIVIQTCLPNATLRINPVGSAILQRLDEARKGSGVAGIMVRCVVYTTRYFTRAEFAGCSTKGDQYARLTALWELALQQGRAPMQNPAISSIVGSVGLWMEDELVSIPGGRYLIPSGDMIPNNVEHKPENQAPLGPAWAELRADAGFLTLDLGGAIPEIKASGTKADFGPLTLQVQLPGGGAKTVATLTPDQYNQSTYESTAGIVDLALPQGLTPDDVRAGTLVLGAGDVPLLAETAFSDSALTAQTDQRGVYVDQGGTGSLTVQVRQKGALPAQTVKLLVQQYLPDPPPPAANSFAWTLCTDGDSAVFALQDAPDGVITIAPEAKGMANISFTAIQPGFPTLVFLPFLEGEPTPQPPAQIFPMYRWGNTTNPLTIVSAFYACARVMPFDNDLPQAFADLWNTTYDQNKAWTFLYSKVLYLYDLMFPVMKYYAGLDLGDQTTVGYTIDLIVQLTATELFDKTVYMPVTRDLSAGKRAVLQMYASLNDRGWPQEPIHPPAGLGGEQ